MKVLIGVDSSAASHTTLEAVIGRRWPEGTNFRFINVIDPTGMARFLALLQEAKRAGEAVARIAAGQLSSAGLKAEFEALVGPVRKELVEYAKVWGANFIYVGSHGQGAIPRFLLGSVAQGVLRTASCSVGVVRPRQGGAGAVAGMKILLGVDGSAGSLSAAQSVAERPWPEGTEVKLVSAVQLVVPGDEMNASSLSAVYPASLLESLLDDAEKRAKEAVASADKLLRGARLGVHAPPKPPRGDPRLVILQIAEEWYADLIVLRSHGWTGLDRLLMGSVSESVTMHAHCSVEVIRA